MPSTLAAVGGSTIIVLFTVAMFLVLAYSYYTIKGSGIDAHPSDGLDGAPGSEGPSSPGTGRGSDDGGTFSSHGTR